MQEIEEGNKKAAPTNNLISIKILAKATLTVNEKVRNQGLSAKEIVFSRDQFSNKNLDIKDEEFAKTVMENRLVLLTINIIPNLNPHLRRKLFQPMLRRATWYF